MKIVVWGAAIVAAILIAIAVVLLGWHKYESAMLNRADGVVVRLDTTRDRLARPLVRFATSTGQDVEFVADDSNARVGDTLHVLYDPMAPSDARVRSFRTTWLVTTVLALLGVAFATVAAGVTWHRGRATVHA